MPSSLNIAIRKESKNAARQAFFIAVIKVIDIRSIEIHCLFYKAQPKYTAIEINILLRRPCNGCNVVNTGNQLLYWLRNFHAKVK